jgi:hypothetical protein
MADYSANMKAWYDAMNRQSDLDLGTPEYEAAEQAESDACERNCDIVLKLFTVEPTTLAGAVALLEFVSQDECLGNCDHYVKNPKTVLSAWTGAKGERGEAADSFPMHLAATMRRLLDGRAA